MCFKYLGFLGENTGLVETEERSTVKEESNALGDIMCARSFWTLCLEAKRLLNVG